MHPIRRHILRRLILGSELRFSELKPPEVESNHFLYYLRQLIGEKLVEKLENGYILSEAGQKYANTVSLHNLKPRLQAKIVTAQILHRNGQILLHRRLRQPFRNQISLVNGKLHYGELVATAASRELKEKTNLSAELEHVGDVYLTYRKGGEPINHLLSHVFVGQYRSGNMRANSAQSLPFWADIRELNVPEMLPGTLEIIELTRKHRHFFFAELSFDI